MRRKVPFICMLWWHATVLMAKFQHHYCWHIATIATALCEIIYQLQQHCDHHNCTVQIIFHYLDIDHNGRDQHILRFLQYFFILLFLACQRSFFASFCIICWRHSHFHYFFSLSHISSLCCELIWPAGSFFCCTHALSTAPCFFAMA